MSGVATTSRVPMWSATAIQRLRDTNACPVCGGADVLGQQCRRCGADFTDGIGGELWDASQAAVAALEARQAVLDRVPLRPRPRVMAPATVPARPAPPSTAGTSATVQSVLAVAGAGLVAIAAIVFTFFNPDLTDAGVRNAVTAGVTLVFLAGARLLVARGLRFSAEAVGALGAVFVGLDVAAVAGLGTAAPWTDAAIATLLAASALLTLGLLWRVRTWIFASLVAASSVPAMLWATTAWSTAALGWFGTAVAASLLVDACRFFGRRAGSALRADRVALTVVQIAANAFAAFVALGGVAGEWSAWMVCGVFAATALLSAFSARHLASWFWSFGAGGSGVLAFIALPFAIMPAFEAGSWFAALLPVSAAVGLVVLAALSPLPRWVRRRALTAGALVGVALAAISPTMSALIAILFMALGTSRGWDAAMSYDGTTPIAVGLAGLAVGLVVFARLRSAAYGLTGAADAAAGPAVGGAGAAGERGTRADSVGLADATDRADAAGSAGAADRADAADGAPGTASPNHPATAATNGRTAVSALPPIHVGVGWVGDLGVWFAGLAVLTLMSAPALPLTARIAVGLGGAVILAVVLLTIPMLRTVRLGVRVPLLVAAHASILLAALISWHDPRLTVAAGVAVVAATALVGRAMPRPVRFLHVGVAYAYALVVLATWLDRAGVAALPLVCLVTSAGALVAVAATFLPRVGPRSWQAILVVTLVPFALGVLQVVVERSGWTALSTGLMFALALTLVITRRPGLVRSVRAVAAASLVPSLAVVIVCLGAQLLPGSGSPVVLPVVAALVALTLPATEGIRSALAPRIGAADASLARLAIEASSLLTAVIAVGLALVRDAAGLGTTLLVLVILGVGAVGTALFSHRRYAWWLAGAAFTGALWCVWGIQGIADVEPYLLPPALVAALVGAILTARGRHGVALYATGLGLAIAPVVVLLAAGGGIVRGIALLAASWALLVLAWAYGAVPGWIGRTGSRWRAAWRLRALRPATSAAAIAAGAAGAVLGARFGLGMDAAPAPLVLVCLGVGLVGTASAGWAAVGMRRSAAPSSRLRSTRWLLVPALLYVGVAAWPAIHRDWFTIWTMWALMVAYLIVMVITSWRVRRRATALPPVWVLFALAFATAVVAWSPRDLRVEWFSLPLGLLLIAAGAVHLVRRDDGGPDAASTGIRRSLSSWPQGWSGSWPLLAPGLVVTFSASISATFTDPQTWRAILVISLALVAILVGARARLAAPFVLGIIVLPVENVLAFVVQIGRGIASMPWWITLAVVGAVLLIIAVSYERREGEEKGVVARLRDLG